MTPGESYSFGYAVPRRIRRQRFWRRVDLSLRALTVLIVIGLVVMQATGHLN